MNQGDMFLNNIAVVTEGQLDVISAWQKGVKVVCSSFGAHCSEAHLVLLNRYVDNIYLLYDNDDAGNRFRADMEKKLPKLFTVYSLDIPYCYKDVNDIPQRELKELAENRRKLKISFIKRG